MYYNNSIWFLDHVGINSKVNYLGKWKKEKYLEYQAFLKNKLDEYLDQNGYKEQLKNGINPIKFWFKGDSINTIFEGSFFTTTELKNDIDLLKYHNEKINAEIFNNIKIAYSDKVQKLKGKVYRLDISTNLNVPDLNEVDVIGRSRKLRKYFEDEDRSKVTGIQYGKRGRQSVHLRCYMKNYDQNKYHDYLRFGRADFTRLEYELGTRPIKNYGMRYLKDFPIKEYRQDLSKKLVKTYEKGRVRYRSRNEWIDEKKFKFISDKINLKKISNWESLLNRIHRTANCIIPGRPVLKPFEKLVMPNKKYEPDTKYYYKEQVEGIIFNHYTREELGKLAEKYKWAIDGI